LNFGDCCSYAVARTLDALLLFVGDDFSQTDVRGAMVAQEQASSQSELFGTK